MLNSNFNLRLVWDLIKYFSNLTANKVPVVRGMVSKLRTVDFSEYMKAYDNTTATFIPYQEMLGKIADLLDLTGGESVVDFGSGTGNLTLEVANRGGKVISIDCSPEANQIHLMKNPQADIVEIDFDRPDHQIGFLPLENESVNRVCAANVWTYIKNRKTLYAEIKRILKPEGTFVLAVERKGYNPGSILKGHFYRAYEREIKNGAQPLTAMSRVADDFGGKYRDLLITAEQTKKLMRGIAAGDYVTFEIDEILRELKENGFEPSHYEISYAGQAIIIKATKAKV
jgi:ubiquinone/menaquinone biosynthesis C-methylase UbiE